METKEWYKEADNVRTMEDFISLFTELSKDIDHDYGSVVDAMSAITIAAAWLFNRSEVGGLTGFQASCVPLQFAKHWLRIEGPFHIQKYSDMLYPQNTRGFLALSRDTWKWLQDKADENLRTTKNAHPDVMEHWKSIVDGTVPFGYTLEDQL